MIGIKHAHRVLSLCRYAVYVTVIALLSNPAFAAVLSSPPTALSINGLPQGGLLGWSLALSANGQVAAGGAPATNRSGTSGTDYTGAAYVYTQANGVWSAPITLSTTGIAVGGQIGNAVAVSANGTQVIVGAPNLNSYTGAVYVYTETNGSWANTPTRTALTLPTGVTTGYSFGFGLAVSSDGQTLIVGAQGAASGQGTLYVYTLSGTTWGSPVALPVTGIASNAHVGGNIAVSADGSVVVAGGPNANSTAGSAYVWTKSGGTWSNPVALIRPSTNGSSGSFGTGVGISGDGTVAIIGAPGANNSYGAAYVYTQTGGAWSATPMMISVNVSETGFGNSVALSPDGKSAFIGAPSGNTGQIDTSTYNGSSWSTPIGLSTTNVPYGSQIGTVLAQADNGQELLTSGESANAESGGLWVYTSPTTITLANSPSATAIKPGSTLTFNLTLTNADQPSGSLPAATLNNVVLTDTLPAGTTYVSSNAANGTCSNSGNTVTCTLSALAPSNNSQNPWTPSITVTTPTTASVLTNTLKVSANEPLVGTTSVNTKVTNDVVPTVTNGFLSTSPNTAISGTLLATPGFTGQKLSFVIETQPADGSVTLDATTGAFTYTPKSGFTGTDVFIFTAGDSIVTSNVGAESITVSAPAGPPTANNGTVTTAENTPASGTLQYTGTGTLSFTIVTQPAHGSISAPNSGGVFTYTPTTGYSGPDSFTFKVTNSLGSSNTATETVTVSAALNQPVAANLSISAYENAPLSGTLPAADAAGNPLSYAVTQPAHGAVSVTASTGAFTYTPTSGYTGDDSFTFTAMDTVTKLTSNTATISIDVKTAPSSGGSGSSGKSGGGALGFLSLGLLGMGWGWRRRWKTNHYYR
ncbi:MAG: beta strand repeat-containing protein [Gammaproteobacteria bacterium]